MRSYSMQIKNVKFIEEGQELSMPAQFKVILEDNSELFVPIDPLNRHFVEVKEWYQSKKKKSFVFDFDAVETENQQ